MKKTKFIYMAPLSARPEDCDVYMIPKDGDPRFCDYCFGNYILVNGDGITIEECHLTSFGLICNRCLSLRDDLVLLKSHKKGVNVKQEDWYNGIYPRNND